MFIFLFILPLSTYSVQVQKVTVATHHTKSHTHTHAHAHTQHTLNDTHTHTHTHTKSHTLNRTPLHEGSTRHRDLYLTTHNIHKTQTSIPLTGFEPAMNIMGIKYCYFLYICTFSFCGRCYRNKRPLVYMVQKKIYKGGPVTCQAGTRGRYRLSPTHTLHRRQRGVGSQRHAPANLLLGKRPIFHCTWVGYDLDGSGKSRPPLVLNPGQSSPQQVAIPSTIF